MPVWATLPAGAETPPEWALLLTISGPGRRLIGLALWLATVLVAVVTGNPNLA